MAVNYHAPEHRPSVSTLALALLMIVAALFVGAAVAYLVVPMEPGAAMSSVLAKIIF